MRSTNLSGPLSPESWTTCLFGQVSASSWHLHPKGMRVRRFQHGSFQADEVPGCSDHFFGYRLDGRVSAERRLGGRWSTAETLRGSLTAMPARSASAWRISGEGKMLHIFVPPHLFEAVERADDRSAPLQIDNPLGLVDPVLVAILERLASETRGDLPWHGMMVEALVIQLVVMLGRRTLAERSFTAGCFSPRQRKHLAELVESRLETDLGVLDLARELGMSLSRFGPSFRRSFGTTPHQYIVQRRVARAMVLLGTDMPIVAIAPAVGFAHQAHLTSTFRRYCGMTPAAYRMAFPRRANKPGVICKTGEF